RARRDSRVAACAKRQARALPPTHHPAARPPNVQRLLYSAARRAKSGRSRTGFRTESFRTTSFHKPAPRSAGSNPTPPPTRRAAHLQQHLAAQPGGRPECRVRPERPLAGADGLGEPAGPAQEVGTLHQVLGEVPPPRPPRLLQPDRLVEVGQGGLGVPALGV